MIVFAVVDAPKLARLENGAMTRGAAGHASDEFSKMKRRIGVMVDAQKQHLAVMIMHAPDRTLGHMGRQWQRIGEDRLRERTRSGESLEMIAAQHARQVPEQACHHAEIVRGWRQLGSKGSSSLPN
jgi:hypothetical protein